MGLNTAPIYEVYATAPLSASQSTDGNSNNDVTVAIQNGANDGDLLIWNAGSAAWLDQSVSGDISINGSGSTNVVALQGIPIGTVKRIEWKIFNGQRLFYFFYFGNRRHQYIGKWRHNR